MIEPQISTTTDATKIALIQKRITLNNKYRNGVNWFFWIAGLSLVNTVIYLFGSTMTFVVGLGATQIVDGFMSGVATQMGQSGTIARVMGFILDVAIAGVFVLLGVLGRKRNRWAIITGMVLYAFDGILLIVFRDYLGAAFHAWALLGIAGSLKPIKDLENLEKSTINGSFQNINPQ